MDETQRAIEEGIRRGIESANRGPEFIEWLMAVIRGLRRVRAPAVAIPPEARNARPASPRGRPERSRGVAGAAQGAARLPARSARRSRRCARRSTSCAARTRSSRLRRCFRDRARCRRNELSRFIRAPRPLRRRADLPDPGRVGVRLLQHQRPRHAVRVRCYVHHSSQPSDGPPSATRGPRQQTVVHADAVTARLGATAPGPPRQHDRVHRASCRRARPGSWPLLVRSLACRR
jgi:hypothetical protein